MVKYLWSANFLRNVRKETLENWNLLSMKHLKFVLMFLYIKEMLTQITVVLIKVLSTGSKAPLNHKHKYVLQIYKYISNLQNTVLVIIIIE